MHTIQEPHASCNGQTNLDEYRRWVFSNMPALGRLLDALDGGGEFSFLDIMAAISEMVAFLTNSDLFDSVESMRFSEMSGKKCRFCC